MIKRYTLSMPNQADFTKAPWNKYPELPQDSIGWRMGCGEDYITGWYQYYHSLSEAEKAEYRRENPEIESWVGFYSNY